jgi:predicted ATPase
MLGIGRTGAQAEAKFVGRGEENRFLVDRLTRARDGKGSLVLVSGEAGIGKTRLVHELGKTAAEVGFLFLTGKCISQKDADPYLPFLDALRSYVRLGEEDGERMPVGLAGLGGVEGGEVLGMGFIPMAERATAESPARVNVQSERDRMFNTLTQRIIGLSKDEPVLLFIDDLQWADNASLQLLYYVTRNVTDARVLVCCAYRPEELKAVPGGQTHPLADMLRRLGQEKLYEEVTLERLKLGEISSMVRDILGIEDVPDKFVRKLYEESEGNPFFVEEVLHALIEEGIVKKDSYVWDPSIDLSSIRIPGTIKDVITRRIARMDDNTKKVLMYAAVIGNQFNFEVLHRVTEVEDHELLDALDKLMTVDIIHEDRTSQDEVYTFDHKQTAAVLYEEMSKSRARLMHKRVGEVTEEVYASRIDEVVYPLARHFTLGKDLQKAYKYNLKAAEKATGLFAYDEAIGYYLQAMRVVSTMPPTPGIDVRKETTRLHIAIGTLHFDMGDWSAAQPSYEAAVQGARALGDRALISQTVRGLADVMRQKGLYIEAEQRYEESLLISEELGDDFGIAEIQRGLGYVHWRRGELDEAIDHYNQAISTAMKIGDMHLTARVYIELGNIYNQRGDQQRAIEYYTKAINELEKVKDYSELARAYNNIGDSCLHLSEWDKAIVYFEKCRTVSEKIGNRNFVAWSLFNAAEAYSHKGNPDKAMEYCHKSLKICEAMDDKIGMNGVYKNFGIAHRMKKEWETAIENHNKSITILEILDIPFDLGQSQFELAMTYKAMGEKEAAMEHLNIALTKFKQIGSKMEMEEVEQEIKNIS